MNGTRPVNACFAVTIDLIKPGPNHRDREPLPEIPALALAMKRNGQESPVQVFRNEDGTYTLFDGHRRLAAAQMAGLPELLVLIKRRPEDAVEHLIRQVSMQANTVRFEPIAEGRACHALMFEYHWSRSRIAGALSKTEDWVRDRIALVSGLLTEDEQAAVQRRELAMADALALTRQRRAERDGTPLPKVRAPGRRRAPGTRESWFNRDHALAGEAKARCETVHTEPVAKIGRTACGQCWEHVIRASAAQPLRAVS